MYRTQYLPPNILAESKLQKRRRTYAHLFFIVLYWYRLWLVQLPRKFEYGLNEKPE